MTKKPIGMIVVGAGGGIGPTHIKSIRRSGKGRLAGLVDVYPQGLTQIVRDLELGDIPCFASVEDCLAKGLEFDAASVASPQAWHEQPVVKLAEAGKHVFVEKPMAATVGQCQRMKAAADKTGVILAGCGQRQKMAPVQRALQLWTGGQLGLVGTELDIGALAQCNVRMNGGRDPWYYQRRDWLGNVLMGDGAILNQAVHIILAALSIAGRVKKLCAQVANTSHPTISGEDVANVQLVFECGALGNWLFSNNDGDGYYCGATLTSRKRHVMEFMTDKRMFVAAPGVQPPPPFAPQVVRYDLPVPGINELLDDAKARGEAQTKATSARDLRLRQMVAADEHDYWTNWFAAPSYHAAAFENFFDAVNGDAQPWLTAADATHAVEVIEAMYRSQANGGTWVDVPVDVYPDDQELQLRKEKGIQRLCD